MKRNKAQEKLDKEIRQGYECFAEHGSGPIGI